MMEKLGEVSLNQKEYDKWMKLKDFDKNSKSIDGNERKYPDFFWLVSSFLYLKFIGITSQAANNFVIS